MRGKNSRRLYLLIILLLLAIVLIGFFGRSYFLSEVGFAYFINTKNLIITAVVGLFALFAAIAPLNDIVQLWDRFKGKPRTLTPDEITQNRTNMLKQMALRIEQTLKSKLLTDEWLKLGFHFDPAHISPLDAPQEWHSGSDVETIRRGTKPITIFDNRAANALLILGEPGSGKTITLFRLAEDLVARAMRDETETIPIVFNLASWAEKQPPLGDWLIEQLERVYRVPQRVAHHWIEYGALTLLLDGLDEIQDETKREACVTHINAYRLNRNLTKIAVCSRINEYEALTTQLELNGAIIIRELRPLEAKSFLKNVATDTSNLLPLFETNEVVQMLAKRPLTLNILTIAALSLSKKELDDLVKQPDQIQPRLYDVYIEEMLYHRSTNDIYSPEKTKKWLSWLAYEMQRRSLTNFFADTLQMDWVKNLSYSKYIFRIVGAIRGFLHFGLNMLLLVGFFTGIDNDLFPYLLPFASITGLVTGAYYHGVKIEFIDIKNIKMNIKKVLRKSSLLLTSLLFLGATALSQNNILVGIFHGVILILVYISVFLVVDMVNILKKQTVSDNLSNPTEPIYRAQKVAVIVSLLGGITCFFLSSLFFKIFGFSGIINGNELIVVAIRDALLWGSVFALFMTVFLYIQIIEGVFYHKLVGYLLAKNDLIPLNFFRFLNFAAQRQLLVKLSGHYEFFHQTLQDHFADMWLRDYAENEPASSE